MPILATALIAVCYGCDQNRSVVQQEISTEMLRSLIKSCKTPGLAASDSILLDGWGTNSSSDNTQILLDTRNPQGDISIRSNRKSARPVLGKGVSGVIRLSRNKGQRDGRGARIGDDGPLKQRAGETSSNFMLHRKIPASFLDKAEEFFCSENDTAANITNWPDHRTSYLIWTFFISFWDDGSWEYTTRQAKLQLDGWWWLGIDCIGFGKDICHFYKACSR